VAALRATGETRLANRLVKLAPPLGRRLATEIVQALSEQTVVVPGTSAAATVLPVPLASTPAWPRLTARL
jgi:hypothetical protein